MRYLTIRTVLSTLALAATAISVSAQAAGAMPEMKGDANARYACGGIGVDESTAMRAAMDKHPLSMLFARSGGDYVGTVEVTITPAKGESATKITADGPVCLVDLPEGKYEVTASTEGKTEKRSVSISGKPTKLDFRF